MNSARTMFTPTMLSRRRRLHGRAEGHGLVGVDGLARLLAYIYIYMYIYIYICTHTLYIYVY